jgi:hypothetical protein
MIDVGGAFRHSKYAPVGMHTSSQCAMKKPTTGATFGDSTSPSNFDPLAIARRCTFHAIIGCNLFKTI